MRGECQICSELYEVDSDIAAIKCGHTFHDRCLAPWLRQSRTCPTCRRDAKAKDVIHKLYFHVSDAERVEDTNALTAQLKNSLSDAEVSVKKKEMEKQEIMKDKVVVENQLAKIKDELRTTKLLLREESTASTVLRREMRFFKDQMSEVEKAREETVAIRKKLDNFTNVERLVNSCQDEIDEMVSDCSDATQLATWCVVLKKELAGKRTQCKKLREQQEQTQKELHFKRRQMHERQKEVEELRSKLKLAEEELSLLEDENRSSKHHSGLLSFSATPGSEGPAAKKPRLSFPQEDSFNTSSDLFKSPPSAGPKPTKTTTLKISSASISSQGKSDSSHQSIADSPVLPYNLNIFKKKSLADNTKIRKGYNGLGGHEKFIVMGNKKPLKTVNGKTSKGPTSTSTSRKTKLLTTKSVKEPPLPTLNGFLFS